MVASPEATASESQASNPESTPEKSGADRRAHKRLRPHELRDLQARLASGADIRLIDLSRGGAQFETDRRFLPNSSIALRLVTPDSTVVVNGRVVRSRIVRLEQGGLGYNVAVSFLEALPHTIETTPAQTDKAASTESPSGMDATPSSESLPVRLGAGMPVQLVSAADAALSSEPGAGEPVVALPSFSDLVNDVTAEEQAAFEATVLDAPPMLTVTAEVSQSSEELRDMFDGNAW